MYNLEVITAYLFLSFRPTYDENTFLARRNRYLVVVAFIPGVADYL